MLKSFSSRKSSPNRTPLKKLTKVQSLLDPSRLRPPPLSGTDCGGGMIGQIRTSNIQPNITLAMQNEEIHQRTTTTTTSIIDENEIISISQYEDDSSVV